MVLEATMICIDNLEWMKNGDYALNRFLAQMSVPDGAKDSSSQSAMTKLLEDQPFVSSILSSLPLVDPNDPSVKELLVSMQNLSEKGENLKGPNQEEEK